MEMRLRNRLAAIGIIGCTWVSVLAQVEPGVKPVPPPPAPTPASQPTGTQPAEGPSPRVEVNPTAFTFGDLWQGEPAKREFTIKNTGDAPMTVTARTSCGCTVATTPKSPLPAGESTTFSVTYDTTRIGPAHKMVTLTTNDPSRPSVEIPVEGNIKPLFLGKPTDSIVFPEIEPTALELRTITLENKYGSPLNLKLREGQDFGPFEITLREIKAGEEYELTAKTKPPLRLGTNQINVVLETGLEKVPTIGIRVAGNAQPRVVVMPPSLVVSPEHRQVIPQLVRVQYHTNVPLKITEVKVTPNSVKYEIMPAEQPAGQGTVAFYNIRVTLPAFAELPDEGGQLEIFTDDKTAEFQHITVPIVKRSGPPQGAQLNPQLPKPAATQPGPSPSVNNK